jgi:hypothetical protein
LPDIDGVAKRLKREETRGQGDREEFGLLERENLI